jgi:hypothetical protein
MIKDKITKILNRKLLVLIVIALFVNLPLINALEISSIRAEDITENGATIKWDTDEAGSSFVSYGDDKDNLQKIGDAKELTEHEMSLENLNEDKEYFYSVESSGIIDDNSGDLYSFKTLIPDTTAPEVYVNLPEMIPGSKFDLVGWTEPGMNVKLYVNDAFAGSTIAKSEVEEPLIIKDSIDEEATIEVEDLENETAEAEETESVLNESEIEVEEELPPLAVKYLETGKQTSVTPAIQLIADSITGESDQEIAENIISWIQDNLEYNDIDSLAKGSISTEEIIEKEEFSGCTDFALVFITLARAKEIPAIYVETIQQEFLEKVNSGEKVDGPFLGHVFADVYVDGAWKAVDPAGGYFTTVDSSCVSENQYEGFNGCYNRKEDGENVPYTIYEKGLDFSALGFNNKKDFVDEIYDQEKALVGSAISFSYLEAPYGKALWDKNQEDKEEEIPENLDGKFVFSNVILNKDVDNQIGIEVTDAAGNSAQFSGTVFADGSKPQITISDIPEIVDQGSFELVATISEESDYEIFVNNESEADGTGTEIKESLSLEEGENIIKIVAKDVAGWETVKEIVLGADTKAPTLKFDISKGSEYYQGRAESSINGETEAGADVYLFVYRPIGYEYSPKFDKVWAKVTADQNGTFKFKEVNFESEPIGLKDISPKEVPQNLLDYSIFPTSSVTDQQQWTYHVFLVAEDKSGKTAFSQTTVTVNTCYSADWDFDIRSVPEFQRPLRLDPGLMDDGREEATAVFNLSYRGSGVPLRDKTSGKVLPDGEAFKVNSVSFDRACTSGMMEDESTKLGCNIMPPHPRKISNNDKTAWYLTYNLHSAEKLSDKEGDFWNEFKKRQIVFPMKVRISYQDRDGSGNLGPVKTQTSCYDLSYFIDIPIDSSEMIPDWLADEGLTVVDETINLIDNILPYLEDAILVAGYACIGSFLGRMVVRWLRIFVAKYESYSSTATTAVGADPEGKKCLKDQSNLILESTRKEWEDNKELFNQQGTDPTHFGNFGYKDEDAGINEDWTNEEYTLDAVCPSTAGMWKAEAILDQLYKWTCDRVYCRAVPAGWTASREKSEVDTVIFKQSQCAVSASGIPLQEVENCNEIIKKNYNQAYPDERTVGFIQKGGSTCYRYNDRLYIDETGSSKMVAQGGHTRELSLIYDFGRKLNTGGLSPIVQDVPQKLIAYKPNGANNYIVGQDRSCKYVCQSLRKPGYEFDVTKSIKNIANDQEPTGIQHGCYREKYSGKNVVLEAGVPIDGTAGGASVGATTEIAPATATKTAPATGTATATATGTATAKTETPSEVTADDSKGMLLKGPRYPAGYTSDCFIDLEPDVGGSAGAISDDFCNAQTGEGCPEGYNCITYEGTQRCIREGTSPSDLARSSLVAKKPEAGYTGLLQCVCVAQDVNETTPSGVRLAAKEEGELSEKWSYRQGTLFKENYGNAGTYYPGWRYYSVRDTSSAFGADYLLDYLRGDDKEVHEVNPHTQFLGAYQTICLSRVRAQLITLKSILEGFRNCIEEAKISGLTDAGVCKTIFSQHVCGLIYKIIAYFYNDCSATNANDLGKGEEGGLIDSVGFGFKAGIESIGEAMQSSIDDIKGDYGNAQLNQYFASGAQGFTQSICMAAFGYDWPMGTDFILDSAYAVSGKTTVLVFPAERELTTFNPQKGSAVYNYNLGAMVLPGCQIKSVDVSLKCIGQEDLDRPGVSCEGQGCDCLHITEESSSLESEKIYNVEHGRVRDLKPGSFVDLEIPAPQKVDSSYRYDHVVVKLNLDAYEESEKCFDEGYRDGVFYYPIIDVSAPAEFICQVQPATGRYFCPEVQQMFGGGAGVYLEDPYMSCYDQRTQSWIGCNTPGIFVKGDPIRVKVHMMTDGGDYCLRTSVSGLYQQYDPTQAYSSQFPPADPLPKGMPGPFSIEIQGLGKVNDGMFSSGGGKLTLDPQSAAIGCAQPFAFGSSGSVAQQESYSFNFEKVGERYRVKFPSDLRVEGLGYNKLDKGFESTLTKDGRDTLTPQEIQAAVFDFGGMKYSNLVGAPQAGVGQNSCLYSSGGISSSSLGQSSISVTAKLLMPDGRSGCFESNIGVKAPAFGRAEHTESITLMLQPLVEQQTSQIHKDFMNNNCEEVIRKSGQVMGRGIGDIEDAVAIYYTAACYISSGQNFKVCSLIKTFSERDYSETIKITDEYQKISKYLGIISDKLQCGTSTTGPGIGFTTGTNGASLGTTSSIKGTCGHEKANFQIATNYPAGWKPDNWNTYVCRTPTGNELLSSSNLPGTPPTTPQCWSRGMYSTQAWADSLSLEHGCGSDVSLLCCPPSK